ncbi:hypothetical protein TA3x_003519 [Tundrisphaera sp. TA3]|uniref:hypothetical protein n=1 Tax=Tundrisphaera sp. TA3 TaxID=3435775 RepID=UPI003EBFBC9A
MIWLLGLPIPPALVVVFAGITLPAALVAAWIGARLIRADRGPEPGGSRSARSVLGGVLVLYGVADVATLVYFLVFWSGDLVPVPS